MQGPKGSHLTGFSYASRVLRSNAENHSRLPHEPQDPSYGSGPTHPCTLFSLLRTSLLGIRPTTQGQGATQVDGTKELKRQVEEPDDLADGKTSKMAGVTEGLAVILQGDRRPATLRE